MKMKIRRKYTISSLIRKLQKLQEKYGDLPIVLYSTNLEDRIEINYEHHPRKIVYYDSGTTHLKSKEIGERIEIVGE